MQGGELAPRSDLVPRAELVPGTELAPCPKSPNCVSSQATEAGHAIEPLQVTGDPVVAWTTLKGVLESMDRMQIVEESDTVLRAEATSRLFRFVDDLEFILDAETPTIHVRSASRVGYSDMGANRKRVEAIRQKLKDACTGS